MLVTSHGYKCECCSFIIPLFVCNRHISEDEACDLLDGKRTVIDGFCSNEGNNFSSILTIEGRTVKADSTVGYCERQSGGGKVIVTRKGFICLKKNSCPHLNCKFPFRRWYNNYALSVEDVTKLLKSTKIQFLAVDENGNIIPMTLSSEFSQEQKLKIANSNEH